MRKLLFVFAFVYLFNFISSENLIKETSKRTHTYVWDVDCNDKINCVDYAVTFKYFWDKYSPKGNSFNCQIIRNKNPVNGFHHLFIRVRANTKSEWIYIEPQAYYPNLDMFEYWGERYDPQYNIYNETYIWKSYL